MTRPKVSVIVVSYNRAADLRLCLTAIFGSKLGELEVIVVDNASTDDAAAVARSFSAVKLIPNSENVGFAAANNLALEQARGEYVALVNNDAVIEDTWLPELVSFLDRTPRAAAAGGRLYHWNDENPLGDKSNHFFGYGELQPDGSTPAARDPADLLRETPFLSGAAVVVRKRAIDEVGAPFLDPLYFMYYEETDFFARAVRRGFRTYFLGSAACWHRIRGGAVRAPYLYHYYMHRNRVLFAHRHFDDGALERLMNTARFRAMSARFRTSLRIGFDKTEALLARSNAWSWVTGNRALLAEERARFRSYGAPLDSALAAISRRERGEAGDE